MESLRINFISKRFGSITGVSDLLFSSASQKAVYGILDPNKAGKTTTIRMEDIEIRQLSKLAEA